MTVGETSQLIAALAAVTAAMAAVAAAIISALGLKRIKHVEHATNSMKDELVAVTRSEAFAAGRKQVMDEQAAGSASR